MKNLSNALLLAVAAGAAASSVLAFARLRQDKTHHEENKRLELGHLQDRALADLTSSPRLAAFSKPEDIEVEEYMSLLAANRQICSVSTRFLVGHLTVEQMRTLAEQMMTKANMRAYWDRYGDWRMTESEDDPQLMYFNTLMADAASRALDADRAPRVNV